MGSGTQGNGELLFNGYMKLQFGKMKGALQMDSGGDSKRM
jgi:hypothetical protein